MLEIDGRRQSGYRTLYFYNAPLCALSQSPRWPARYKVRSRQMWAHRSPLSRSSTRSAKSHTQGAAGDAGVGHRVERAGLDLPARPHPAARRCADAGAVGRLHPHHAGGAHHARTSDHRPEAALHHRRPRTGVAGLVIAETEVAGAPTHLALRRAHTPTIHPVPAASASTASAPACSIRRSNTTGCRATLRRIDQSQEKKSL